MPDFLLTDPEGGQHKLIGPEGASAEEARELAAQSLARGAQRGGPRPEAEVPHDYQTWGNLAEATAERYPHPPEDIRQIPAWMREHPEEISSIGMGGITAPVTRPPTPGGLIDRTTRSLSPAQVNERLQHYNREFARGRITEQELGGFRVALGLPEQGPRPLSAQRSQPQPHGIERTMAEMRATPPEETEQAMVRRAVAAPRIATSQRAPLDIFAGPGYDDEGARAIYTQHIAPHFPDTRQFLNNYFAGANLTDATIRSKSPGGILIDGFINTPQQGKIGQIQREIYPADGIAKHEYLQIDDRARGAGFVKQMTANQIALYQKMGLERVSLLANLDIGGYAWAKYGWLPTKEEWLSEHQFSIIGRLWDLDAKGLIPPAHAQNVRKLLDSPDPRTIWRIADDKTPFDPSRWQIKKRGFQATADPKTNTVGKALLAGQQWGGELELGNPEQMRRFNHYVGQ